MTFTGCGSNGNFSTKNLKSKATESATGKKGCAKRNEDEKQPDSHKVPSESLDQEASTTKSIAESAQSVSDIEYAPSSISSDVDLAKEIQGAKQESEREEVPAAEENEMAIPEQSIEPEEPSLTIEMDSMLSSSKNSNRRSASSSHVKLNFESSLPLKFDSPHGPKLTRHTLVNSPELNLEASDAGKQVGQVTDDNDRMTKSATDIKGSLQETLKKPVIGGACVMERSVSLPLLELNLESSWLSFVSPFEIKPSAITRPATITEVKEQEEVELDENELAMDVTGDFEEQFLEGTQLPKFIRGRTVSLPPLISNFDSSSSFGFGSPFVMNQLTTQPTPVVTALKKLDSDEKATEEKNPEDQTVVEPRSPGNLMCRRSLPNLSRDWSTSLEPAELNFDHPLAEFGPAFTSTPVAAKESAEDQNTESVKNDEGEVATPESNEEEKQKFEAPQLDLVRRLSNGRSASLTRLELNFESSSSLDFGSPFNIKSASEIAHEGNDFREPSSRCRSDSNAHTASPPLLELNFESKSPFSFGSPIDAPSTATSNPGFLQEQSSDSITSESTQLNAFEKFMKENIVSKPLHSDASRIGAGIPLPPTVKRKRNNPYSRNNSTRESLLMTLHQVRIADMIWSETLVHDKFFGGLKTRNAAKVLSAFHDECLVIVATPEVKSLRIEAKSLMIYGWREMENWVLETIAKKHKLSLDCKVTGTQFWSHDGDLELETKDGIFSGSLNFVMEEYLLKSLTLTFSEFYEH